MAGTLIASFHLVREQPGRTLAALARLGTDRPVLARTDGLVFWRLLGTGRGSDTGRGADPGRTALFAAWEGDAALDRFLDHSPIAQRWGEAAEAYTVRLRVLGGHGTWRGFDVVDRVAAGVDDGGPVAFVTRATVRARRWRPFLAAGHRVSGEVAAAPGLLAVAGIGEAPLGRQATFSLWTSAAAAMTFASTSPHHREAVRRTRAEGWYGEELFAHFQPYRSQGTWDGRDPLAT